MALFIANGNETHFFVQRLKQKMQAQQHFPRSAIKYFLVCKIISEINKSSGLFGGQICLL